MLWIDLFSDDPYVVRVSSLNLSIVGSIYLCFDLGLGLFFVTEGVGRGVVGMNANLMGMIASAGGGLVAIYAFDLGITGFFASCRWRLLPLCGNTRPRSIEPKAPGRRMIAWVRLGSVREWQFWVQQLT
jgi:hypothetical protein